MIILNRENNAGRGPPVHVSLGNNKILSSNPTPRIYFKEDALCNGTNLGPHINSGWNDNNILYSMDDFQTGNNFTDGGAMKKSDRNLFLAKQEKGGLFW